MAFVRNTCKKHAKLNRDELIDFLTNAGIGTGVHYTPLHRQPYWKKRYKLSNEDFPVSEKAYSTMLSIPLYTAMSDTDQDMVIENLHKALK